MSLLFAEGKVTQLRQEFKVLLDRADATHLENTLCQTLGMEPPAATRITSVYFDSPALALTHRAMETPADTLKIRTKEYFPDLGASGLPRVVLEAKRERGGLTRKRRAETFRAAATQGLRGSISSTTRGSSCSFNWSER